jgi:hypothetical protein
MTRQDWLTHLALGGGFFAILAPFLVSHSFSFGSGLYVAGTVGQIVIATVAHHVGGRS